MLADVSKDYRVFLLQSQAVRSLAIQPFQNPYQFTKQNNLTSQVSTNAVCFISDIMLPTTIICVLLIGNGVIIFVIFYLRKR